MTLPVRLTSAAVQDLALAERPELYQTVESTVRRAVARARSETTQRPRAK